MLRHFLYILGFNCLFLASLSLSAESELKFENLKLKAQSISQNSKEKKLILKGNVQIFYQDLKFEAEDAEIDFHKKIIKIQKKAKFSAKDISASAENLEYNYEKNTGVFHKATLKSGQATFEGELITQTELKKYIITNGFYTACTNCPPLWSFSSTEIHAHIGKYAHIKHPKLKIFNFPILYSPVFIIPLKTKRQSGLLAPSIYVNELGTLGFSQSYFWAISRSEDLTLTGSYYVGRGVKWISDYRYILNENSEGNFKAGTINDQDFQSKEKRRWFLEYQHYQRLREGTVHRAHFSWISDILYPQEFPRDILARGEPALENKLSLTHNWNNHHFSVDVDYYLNLLKKGPEFTNDDAVHRLPSITYSFAETSFLGSPFYFNVTANYTNFFRPGPSFDDVEDQSVIDGKQQSCRALGTEDKIQECLSQIRYIKEIRDGVFNPERDIIRTGQRLLVQPKLSLPLQIKNLFFLTPSVFYRQAYYVFSELQNNTTKTSQSFIETSLKWETQAKTTFKMNKKTYHHKFKPILEYSHVPWTHHENHTFFGDFVDKPYRLYEEILTEDDFYSDELGTGKVQFDYDDRLFKKKIISYTLKNEVTIKENNKHRKFITFSLNQYYDFNQKTVGKLSPWSPFLGKLQFHGSFFDSYTFFKYYNSLKQFSFHTKLNLNVNEGFGLGLSYDRAFAVDSQGEAIENSFNKDVSIDMSFKNSFLKLKGKINYSTLTSLIKSWEYSTSLLFPGECWQINFGQIRPLNSRPIFQLNFLFRFDE